MWIYIVRHAETDGNRQRIVQTPDTPLSVRGQQQAKQFASAYSHLSSAHILCSDHQRTQSTASELHKQLNCPLTLSELLRERNFGDLRGKAYDDIKHDFFAEDYHPPNGESYPQFADRVANAWQQIVLEANNHDGDLVVITHGLVVRCLLTEVLHISPQLLSQTDIQNTCVTQVSRLDHQNMPLFCDVSHLDDEILDMQPVGAV
jgi:probable phosphoglycerate mutase